MALVRHVGDDAREVAVAQRGAQHDVVHHGVEVGIALDVHVDADAEVGRRVVVEIVAVDIAEHLLDVGDVAGVVVGLVAEVRVVELNVSVLGRVDALRGAQRCGGVGNVRRSARQRRDAVRGGDRLLAAAGEAQDVGPVAGTDRSLSRDVDEGPRCRTIPDRRLRWGERLGAGFAAQQRVVRGSRRRRCADIRLRRRSGRGAGDGRYRRYGSPEQRTHNHQCSREPAFAGPAVVQP